MISQGISVFKVLHKLSEWEPIFEPFSVRVLLSLGQRLKEEIGESPTVRSLHVLIGMTEWREGFLASRLLRRIGVCPELLREFALKLTD